MASKKQLKKPNFFLVGAPKCGTTSLAFYLSQHPQVCMADPKEPHFFDYNYEWGLDYYWKKHFQHYQKERAVGEATSSYLLLPFVPERIRQSIQKPKIIVLLRDPVERAYSEWWMQKSRGVEKLSFEAAVFENYKRIKAGISLQDESAEWLWQGRINLIRQGRLQLRTYLDGGRYIDYLENYWKCFSKDQLKVYFLKDLKTNPQGVINSAEKFLGIDVSAKRTVGPKNVASSRAWPVAALAKQMGFKRLPYPLKRVFKKILRRAFPRPPMSLKTRKWLAQYYRPYNQRLAQVLGKDLSHWS